MIFLIQYNRPTGRIVTLRVFDDSERAAAEDFRLELDLDLHRRKIHDEVVLLQAISEDAIRRTHRRYFEDLDQIAKSAAGSLT